MKLKKFLLILLAAIACVCVGFAFGCKDDENTAEKLTVTFASSDHVTYVIDGEEKDEYQLQVDKDTKVTFSVKVEDGFLADTVVVKANNETLVASDGVYEYTVLADVTFTATVQEDLLEGSGTQDDPFLVSSLKDLRFVADRVNSSYAAYVTGYYELQNDIDCGGEQLDVIGHYENSHAFFAGVFDGKNHTISNYTISTNGSSYVGLFGCAQISTASSAVMILNLNLKDFTINAIAGDNSNVAVGAIVGFSAGANIVACSAEGEINVSSSGYFSYAGGAVGVQQSVSVNASGNVLYHYHATAEYIHTNVTISASRGYVAAAGGVVGYAMTIHERAASTILNSYSEGSIFGAMHSGGIVGNLGDYCSVVNCYSKGYVQALANFPSEVTDPEYFALAGGIAGYAGVETSISDSFSVSILDASGSNTGELTGETVAHFAEATDFANSLVVYNVPTGSAVKPTDANFIKNTLKWNETDWVIVDGAYPTTNYASGENDFAITLNFLDKKVNGNASTQISFNVKDESYFPFSSYLDDDIKEYYVSDTAGYTSYGFFFDEECTLKVPYSYVPTRDITLYVGFKNYSEVADTYEFVEKSGRTVKLILNTDATYQFVDVMTFDGLNYTYDGEKLILKDGLFARLSENIVGDQTPQPWLNFQPYTFIGTIEDGKLFLYDGTYFVNDTNDKGEDMRLVFVPESQNVNANNFLGVWERSANIKEKYTFNDDLTWSYVWKTTSLSGTYSLKDGVATLTGGISATASIDASGLLLIKESGKDDKYFRLENSFYGSWYSSKNTAYLVLDGFGSGLAGSASAIVNGVVYDNLSYVKDGFFDNVTGNAYTYTILSGYSLFGYFTYDPAAREITAMLYDEEAEGFIEFNYVLLDYYLGEWIGEGAIGEEPITILNFNGLGFYKTEGDATLGYVVINGTRVPYECSVESGLEGTFTYEGTTYTLTTDGNGVVTVTPQGGTGANLERKDEMANMPLTDDSGNIYKFNGGGNLSKGGIMTKTTARGVKTEYNYKIVSGSVDGLDIVINLYNGSVDGTPIGSITINKPKFVLKLDGERDVSLDLYFPFAGKTWAISDRVNSFYIGRFDLTYETTGNFNGEQNVPFVYFPEYNYIYIFYGNSMDGFVQIYLLIMDDGNLMVSSYPYAVEGDYSYAAPADEFFGDWTNTENRNAIRFNGLADSLYSYGIAFDTTEGITYYYTRGFGKVYMWLYNDMSIAYTVELIDDEITGANIYLKDGGTRYDRLKLEEVDIVNSPIFTGTDGDGTVYKFNFDGTVTVGGKSGKFTTTAVDKDSTTVLITVDGKEITVVVGHSGNITVTD